MTVLVLYLAALGPCEGENERNNCCACVRVGTGGLVGTRGPVDTPTNGKGAGEGGGSDKSSTVAVYSCSSAEHNFHTRERNFACAGKLTIARYFEVQDA